MAVSALAWPVNRHAPACWGCAKGKHRSVAWVSSLTWVSSASLPAQQSMQLIHAAAQSVQHHVSCMQGANPAAAHSTPAHGPRAHFPAEIACFSCSYEVTSWMLASLKASASCKRLLCTCVAAAAESVDEQSLAAADLHMLQQESCSAMQ